MFTLGQGDPVALKGEIEHSSSNYFCLRVADHVQFYTYTDNINRHPAYLFSIRSFTDEKIKLCSGGQERFATSRIALTYHIQVFDFPQMKKAKLNGKNGSNKTGERHRAVNRVVKKCAFRKYRRPDGGVERGG